MRPKSDISYEDYKIQVDSAFYLLKDGEVGGAQDVSEWLYGQIEEYGDGFTDTIAMLFIISIAEYEVRHNILEDRIRNGAAYHIYRYENMGRYKQDLKKDEIEELKKDIAFIKNNAELPELMSYEDREYWYKGKLVK